MKLYIIKPLTVPPIQKIVNEKGALPFLETEQIEQSNITIPDNKTVFMGSSHIQTIEIVRAFAKKHANPGFVMLDAHFDALEQYQGKKDIIRSLVDDQIIKPENITIVGARESSSEEQAYVRKHHIRVFSMKQITEQGVEEFCHNLMERARQCDGLYLSIDIDVLDPAFAPESNSPGGLTTRELIHIVQKISLLQNLKCMDIMEITNPVTTQIGVKIAREFY